MMEKRTFKDCSFKIFNNKINTIVGNSGVGKSTLIDLLISFQLPTSGSIFYGQNNLKDLDLKYLRQNIGYVPQDPFLFDTTIKKILSGQKKMRMITKLNKR